ncbi:DUF5668 domain-containing protein [Fictibacillus sp. WQ 8-8]|uniref:DUF5668 domain-containing protein n=1 Tax=Fictibacillus marinisediminis TaxID=2878389 RepID=A0A9X1XBN6_9BACL|nr:MULTISPECIES: DUF5668 domain-containing protein [Fictibacillus]MCK6257947.1 DUF5668 domain-containing protein [Fictibacillus marinisediminis]MCQ6266468.1 DUF5668 domain-containing protein [Fictibacillus sp. WQ 8-8]MED2972957.1 DUF5668 domain-containing protein [Fictibacillus sp. B-59209]
MKGKGNFSGIVLLGIGLFFLARQMNVTYVLPYLTWPTFLIIIGLAFLVQSASGKEGPSAFSAILLLGLGIHFHAISHIDGWPKEPAMIILIIALAFLYMYKQTKEGLLAGIVLLAISGWSFFNKSDTPSIKEWFSSIEGFWPFILIGVGAYFIFIKKK